MNYFKNFESFEAWEEYIESLKEGFVDNYEETEKEVIKYIANIFETTEENARHFWNHFHNCYFYDPDDINDYNTYDDLILNLTTTLSLIRDFDEYRPTTIKNKNDIITYLDNCNNDEMMDILDIIVSKIKEKL